MISEASSRGVFSAQQYRADRSGAERRRLAQRAQLAQDEAAQVPQELEEEACGDPPPVLKVLSSLSGLAHEHSGQGGRFARELRSSSSKRW